MYSKHSRQRCQSRGIVDSFVHAILSNADLDNPIGQNCRLLRVSSREAKSLNINDRLARYAVIWSDSSSQIVTILPIHHGGSGARYRRKH